jgi:hypothetical protein
MMPLRSRLGSKNEAVMEEYVFWILDSGFFVF